MLAELVDRGIRADRVFGTSVGAINGAAYCGDPTARGIDRLIRVWAELTSDDVFPQSRAHGPWRWFQQRPAMHSGAGLRRVAGRGLTFENLEDATVPLEVVATALADGRERWISRGPALEAIMASAAIPALLPPVVIGDETFIDGGVVDNVPISRALASGATRVYVLLCGPLHYRPPAARRPVEAALTAFFIALHARFERELELLPPGVDVVVFSGGGEPSIEYRDFSGTRELIEEGRREVAAVLDGAAAAAGGVDPATVVGDGAPAGAADARRDTQLIK
jgi:NTE family protein